MADHIPRPENQAKFKLRGSKKLLDDSVQDDEPLDEVKPQIKQSDQKKPQHSAIQPLSLNLTWLTTVTVAHPTTSALG
jgi:hypothetical protein